MKKAQIHKVNALGQSFLISAMNKRGAKRDFIEYIRKQIVLNLATGEEIYFAGQVGQAVIGDDKYANITDPNQLPLTGVDEVL